MLAGVYLGSVLLALIRAICGNPDCNNKDALCSIGLNLLSSVLKRLGIPPVVFIAVSVVKNAFYLWNHASWVGRPGWLDRWLATPMIPKVHHANHPQPADCNYGQLLIEWDRLFGSYAQLEREPNPGFVKTRYDYIHLIAQLGG